MTLTAWRRFALVVGVVALAACLRLWRIAELPPGLHHDEAFHLLRAQEIARGQSFPVYSIGNNGNEPLFAYLTSLMLPMLGPLAWAGRLMAGWVGLVGVAFTVRAGREMFPRQGIGELAGVVLAAFYWHLNFSRFGSQPILAATAAAGTMAALWRGVRTGSYGAYGLSGWMLGLGLWAYVAFRVFPLVPLLGGLILMLTQPARRRHLLVGGMIAGGPALVTYAPLGLFFFQHPNWFFNRFNQTTESTLGLNGRSAALWINTYRTVGGLFLRGDENWRHNLAGRPALDPIQQLFIAAGGVAGLRQWRQAEVWTLWVWLVVGLLPAALTLEAPHFGRTTLATPAVGLLVALGIRAVWRWINRRVMRGLLAVAVLASVCLTLVDYFARWANNANLLEAFDVEQVWIAQALRAAPTGARLYATPLEPNSWTVEYLLGPEAFERLRVFDGSTCLVMPFMTPPATAYAIVAAKDSHTLPALRAAFPQGIESASPWQELAVYQIPAGQAPRIALDVSREADFGRLVRIVGYTLTTEDLKPGRQIHLKVAWQVEQATRAAYKVFVHLIGPPRTDGSIIYAQSDVEPCAGSHPTWGWSPGELILDSYTLFLPEDLPPGNYVLQTGWYDGGVGGTGERLSVFDQGGQPSGDAVKLEQIHINAP